MEQHVLPRLLRVAEEYLEEEELVVVALENDDDGEKEIIFTGGRTRISRLLLAFLSRRRRRFGCLFLSKEEQKERNCYKTLKNYVVVRWDASLVR